MRRRSIRLLYRSLEVEGIIENLTCKGVKCSLKKLRSISEDTTNIRGFAAGTFTMDGTSHNEHQEK